MKKRLFFVPLIICLMTLGACTVDKKTQERLTKIEQRLEAIEKMLTPPKDEHPEQKEAFDIPVGNSFVLPMPGGANKAHIVVFSNFQCPYCAQADEKLRALLKDPKIADRVDVVFKHFPFDRHPFARPASKVALAAGEQGNDKFWAMVDKLFKNQEKFSDANFSLWAKEIGLNMPKFQKDLKDNDKKYDEIINEDIKLGAEKAQLRGTPWIVVDGWLLEGDITPATIESMLNKKKN